LPNIGMYLKFTFNAVRSRPTCHDTRKRVHQQIPFNRPQVIIKMFSQTPHASYQMPTIGIACHSLRLDGGMGRYSLALVKGLNELNIEPVVFTKKIDRSATTDLKFQLELINCRWLPTKLRDYFYNIQVEKIAKKYNLTSIISCNRYVGANICICGGTHKGYLTAINKKPSFFDKRMINLENQFYQRSQLIVAHSNGMANEVHKLYNISSSKITTIYPPFDTSRFNNTSTNQLDRLDFYRQNNIPSDNTLFLIPSAGNHYVKGLDFLINFFNETHLPISLIVAGRPIKPSRNVFYIGFRHDMEVIYKFVDYLILSSRYEAFGMVAIESILSGTPVILSKNIYSNEIIRPEAKILFDRLNQESLETAINTAIAHKHKLINPLQYILPPDTEVEHVTKILQAAHLF